MITMFINMYCYSIFSVNIFQIVLTYCLANRLQKQSHTFMFIKLIACILKHVFLMKRVLVIKLRASKARVPKDILLNCIIDYILYIEI